MHQAQQLAADTVGQVLAGHNLGVALEAAFTKHPGFSSQQRGLLQDLSFGTLRHCGRLQALLGQLLQKPLKDGYVQHLLLIALYQLEYTEAASHTVVNQAVLAASSRKRPWAKGLVNGVLRNYLRQQQALQEWLQGADEAAQYSYPQWWIAKLKLQYPDQWKAMLEIGNQHPPMTLRVNRRNNTVDAYVEKLAALGIEATPLGTEAIMLARPLPVDKLPGFFDGDASVQDYGAQYAAHALDVQDGMRVLDACCAPGGKTCHILELADVEMLALDSDAKRLQRTQENLDRLHLKANLVAGNAACPTTWWDGKPFDRILADVPCTASGIVRRHVDIKWLRRETDIQSFVQQQAAILPELWQLLAKGGKLLYATCSVFLEENQQQVDSFLQRQGDAMQLPLSQEMLHAQHGQLYPCAEHDGFFYALLQKK